MNMKLLSGTALACAMLLNAGHALALDGAELYMTKTCFSCHGKDAQTPIMPAYPKLAGQNAAYAAQQMKDIKSGARANGMSAAMKGVMHLVNDEEIDAIAAWLATL
jgi:cytochrome c